MLRSRSVRRAISLVISWVCVVCSGCEERRAPPLSSLAPAPLQPLGAAPADAGKDPHRLAPAPVWGAPLPAGAVRVTFERGHARAAAASVSMVVDAGVAPLLAAIGRAPALLVPDDTTYVVELAPLLAALEDAHVATWILHGSGAVAFPVTLRDEREFDAWLDEPKPGKLRIIQRQDGLELVSAIGKIPGPDPNGPTVPLRGGRLDVGTTREGLQKMQLRFHAPDACLVPSFGTELRAVATVLSAFWGGPAEPLFETVCLVYPRPR
ncbi:MAG: hypothetical protein ACXU88_16650 [Myxococcaceae bacterium]